MDNHHNGSNEELTAFPSDAKNRADGNSPLDVVATVAVAAKADSDELQNSSRNNSSAKGDDSAAIPLAAAKPSPAAVGEKSSGGGNNSRQKKPRPGEPGCEAYRAAGKKRRRIIVETEQQAWDRVRQQREDILRGYQLKSGAALLEKQLLGNQEIFNHSTANQYLAQTIETMRDESEGLWNREEFGRWERDFQQLCEFKMQYGHTSVPKKFENQNLRKFAVAQRNNRRAMTNQKYKKQSSIDSVQHQIECLDKMGFQWSTSTQTVKTWEEHFQDLVEYKKQHGDCVVPTIKCLPKDSELRGLSYWVITQRRKYFEMKNRDPAKPTRPSMMTPEQAQRLDELGMVWNANTDKTWDDYFRMLLDFKSEHGHCKVPQQYEKNRELGTWVHRMRRNYRHKQRGESSRSLTDERIKILEDLGFVWKTKETPNRDYSINKNRKQKKQEPENFDQAGAEFTAEVDNPFMHVDGAAAVREFI